MEARVLSLHGGCRRGFLQRHLHSPWMGRGTRAPVAPLGRKTSYIRAMAVRASVSVSFRGPEEEHCRHGLGRPSRLEDSDQEFSGEDQTGGVPFSRFFFRQCIAVSYLSQYLSPIYNGFQFRLR